MASAEHIFRDNAGTLEFIGDFDGLYEADADPWGQSGEREEADYYRYSRAKLFAAISTHTAFNKKWEGVEVGCGLGHVTAKLDYIFGGNANWYGVDVSAKAIEGARKRYPNLEFKQANVMERNSLNHAWHDVIVLNQMIWYVLHGMDDAIEECCRWLAVDGLLIISQAYLREQRYGRDIAMGFQGVTKMMLDRYSTSLKLIEARFDDSKQFNHDDGLLVFRRH